MTARFIKLSRVQVQGYDAQERHLCQSCMASTVLTVDMLLNVEMVATIITDTDAESAVVTLADGRFVLVSNEQAEAIEAVALGEASHA